MADLDVGRDGVVWGCSNEGVVVSRVGISEDNFNGVSWQTADSD